MEKVFEISHVNSERVTYVTYFPFDMLFVDLKEPERILFHMSPTSFSILDLYDL